MRNLYENEFRGMALTPISYTELEEARENLINQLDNDLTDREREFLITFKSGEPDWELLGLQGIEHFPAIKWKLHNLKRMDSQKHQRAIEELKRKLKI